MLLLPPMEKEIWDKSFCSCPFLFVLFLFCFFFFGFLITFSRGLVCKIVNKGIAYLTLAFNTVIYYYSILCNNDITTLHIIH